MCFLSLFYIFIIAHTVTQVNPFCPRNLRGGLLGCVFSLFVLYLYYSTHCNTSQYIVRQINTK
nr:MAG TPA: hypothetical protein [Caudoviricetes sp.]